MNRYTVGSDVSSDEELYDAHGNRIDEDYIERAVADVHRSLSGRPSLSGHRSRSPQIAFRLPAEEREQAQRLAEAEGVSLSEFARQALEERLVSAGPAERRSVARPATGPERPEQSGAEPPAPSGKPTPGGDVAIWTAGVLACAQCVSRLS